MDGPRWIIHLPTALTSRDAAATLAEALRNSLGHVTAIDFGETTLSEEDRQFRRIRVWCDHRLPDGARCIRHADHPGDCSTPDDVSDSAPKPPTTGPPAPVHRSARPRPAQQADPHGRNRPREH
nr:hypothetical protein [Micromonospora thermarum]